MAYQTAAKTMALSGLLQALVLHFHVLQFHVLHFQRPQQDFNWYCASRGPFAIAALFLQQLLF